MKKIIDVSEWQGNIDFNKVKKSGISGVIIRAGYGKGNIDSKFIQNINNAIAAKMEYIGVYWFSYAYSEDMARKEAAYCNDIINKYKSNINLPIFFDYEYDSLNYANRSGVYPGKTMITSMTDQFCSRIKKLGYKSGYYCNYDFQNNYINTSALTEYDLWFADWDGDIYENCYIQQYTDKGIIDGINGNVDLNYYIAAQPEPTKNYITVNDVVNGIWNGDFGNGDERKDNLYNYFQNKVNEGRPTDVNN